MKTNTLTNMIIGFLLIFFLPLAIANVVLYSQKSNYCDNGSSINIGTADWLLGLGVAMFIVIISGCIIPWTGYLQFKIVALLFALFLFSWFVVGTIALFQENTSCIQQVDPMTIYALILWIFLALIVLSAFMNTRTDLYVAELS